MFKKLIFKIKPNLFYELCILLHKSCFHNYNITLFPGLCKDIRLLFTNSFLG